MRAALLPQGADSDASPHTAAAGIHKPRQNAKRVQRPSAPPALRHCAKRARASRRLGCIFRSAIRLWLYSRRASAHDSRAELRESGHNPRESTCPSSQEALSGKVRTPISTGPGIRRAIASGPSPLPARCAGSSPDARGALHSQLARQQQAYRGDRFMGQPRPVHSGFELQPGPDSE